MTDRYRLRRDGKTLAKSEGQHALRTIMYAVAELGGPLVIERGKGKRWSMFGRVG